MEEIGRWRTVAVLRFIVVVVRRCADLERKKRGDEMKRMSYEGRIGRRSDNRGDATKIFIVEFLLIALRENDMSFDAERHSTRLTFA